MTWIIYEFWYWKVTKWRNSESPYGIIISHEIFQFFRYKARLYTKKIQVSRGIFNGIPLESDRWCLTCRNRQITEDVRKLRFEFSRGNTRRFYAELVRYPKIFCLSNRALFPCLHIASSKHQEGWENSPNPASVKMRLCKHRKSALLLLWNNS